MERQLIILCSEDLLERVLHTLNRILDQGYLRLPNAVGIKPKEHVTVDTTLAFAAEVFLVTSPAAQVEAIVSELKGFANQCRTKPCLKMIVSEVSQVF